MITTCDLCHEDVDGPGLEGIVDHIRVMHPDDFDEPERWPDGQLVLLDATDPTADEIGGMR